MKIQNYFKVVLVAFSLLSANLAVAQMEKTKMVGGSEMYP